MNPEPRKGVLIFVRIAQVLAARRPDIRLLIVEGASKARFLSQLAIDLARLPKICITPNTPDARRFLAQSKMLLMPSLMENAGLVAIEAMFNGIPVLASTRGGLPETIAGQRSEVRGQRSEVSGGISAERNEYDGGKKGSRHAPPCRPLSGYSANISAERDEYARRCLNIRPTSRRSEMSTRAADGTGTVPATMCGGIAAATGQGLRLLEPQPAKTFGHDMHSGGRGPRLETDAGNGPLDADGPDGFAGHDRRAKLRERNGRLGGPGSVGGCGGDEPIGVPTLIAREGIGRPAAVIDRQLIVVGVGAVRVEEEDDAIVPREVGVAGCVGRRPLL